MSSFWEKVKISLEDGAKTVSEKAPIIASKVAAKSKEIAASVSEKTQEFVTLSQLKLKHYNLNRDVSSQFTALGGRVYDLIKKNNKDIYADAHVKKALEEVKKLEIEIENVEEEIEKMRTKESKTTVTTEEQEEETVIKTRSAKDTEKPKRDKKSTKTDN